jgi:predicted amidohydrolase YtcJ
MFVDALYTNEHCSFIPVDPDRRSGAAAGNGAALVSITVFTGGTVIIDPDRHGHVITSRALAIAEGRVVAEGDAAVELAALHGSKVIDLAGGLLAPAIGDGHAHPVLGGLEATGPQVRDASDLAGILAAVATWKRDHPDAAWIVGGSYDTTFAADGLFDARWLDEVTGDTPTILRAWDYHTAWVNSAALTAGGITAATPDPALGRIPRRDDGSPLGTLQEGAANDFLAHVVPHFSTEQRVAALEQATREYAAQGTTWVQDAWVDPQDVETYRVAAAQQRLHTRVNLAFRADPARWQDQIAEFVGLRDEIRSLEHDRLSAETIKFFLDGVIESHTAAMLDPYADRPNERGLPNWSETELTAAALAFDAEGFQLHLHAIGDAANRLALDALEATATRNPPRERAHVIAHVAVLAPGDAQRFAKIGVIANFEPYWAQCDAVMRDLTIPHLGHDREGWQYLIGTVLRTGATITFGSDWPVTTKDWRPAFATAVTRHSHLEPESTPWLPSERITPGQALAAYTSGIARQALVSDRGTLETGMVADLVWLSADPLSIDPHSVPEIQVLGTWLAGERTFGS